MSAQPLRFGAADDREELARAELYGLLAQLFYAPPTAQPYAQLQVAVTEAAMPGAFLEHSFGELVAAARRLSLDAVHSEYDALFQSVGKPQVLLCGSFYLVGALNEKPLVALRHDLRALGLERGDGIEETEDHIACLCEVMRFLIAGDDLGVSNLAGQQRFFNAHLLGWNPALWDAIASNPRADFYRAAARLGRDFFAVEAQAFDLLEAG